MRKMIILCLSLIIFNLTACSPILKPYRPPVQQGNIITPTMVQQLKTGMSKSQVVKIFGEPVLSNPFDLNTWNYIYILQPSKGATTRKQLTINFINDRVSSFFVGIPSPQLHNKRFNN